MDELSVDVGQELAVVAAHFLYEGAEHEALNLFLFCAVEFRAQADFVDSSGMNYSLPDRVILGAPRRVFEILSDVRDLRAIQIKAALEVAARSRDEHSRRFDMIVTFRPEASSESQEWIDEVRSSLTGVMSIGAEWRIVG